MPPFTRTRRLALGGALAATAALFAAPAALAGDAFIDSQGLAHYTANFGEDNSLRVGERPHPTNPAKKVVVFTDVEPVDADNGCAQVNNFEAECNVPVSHAFVRADLATLDDRIEPALGSLAPASLGFSADGNPGNDVLGGSAQRDLLFGGDGDDSIVGRLGNDHLEGGWGNDSITGGAGQDRMEGGPGADTLNANDGVGGDDVDCGAGNDLVIYNPGDTIEDCERTQLIVP
jgi:hypothetical protein